MLKLHLADFSREVNIAKGKEASRKEVKTLQQQVQGFEQYNEMGSRCAWMGKRSNEGGYSKRYLRQLKNHCAASSLASLSWLEREGLKPLLVEVSM